MPLNGFARVAILFLSEGRGCSLVRRKRLQAKDASRSRSVPAKLKMMADRNFRNSSISKRSKTILEMVKENSVVSFKELSPTKTLQTKKCKPKHGPTNFLDSYYARPYSMVGNIFNTFCETQTTYKSYHLSSLDTSELKQALLNESAVYHTENVVDTVRTPIQLDLTCNETMPPEDSPFDKEVPLISKATSENSLIDFDSDDSVLDKNYCPSDNLESPMSDVSERKKKSKKKKLKTKLSTGITKSFNINNIQALERRRRFSIGDICCKNTSPDQPFLRKRRSTVDGNFCSTLLEISELPRKRKKYDTSLKQRKLDAKIKTKIVHSVKPGCNEKCIRRCMTLFTEEDRNAINRVFWDMSWQERHAFVEAHTYVAVPKRKITSQPKRNPKRNFILKKQDGSKQEVCKIFFLTTLGYLKNNDRILHITFTDPSTDKRGKHQKTPAFDRDLLNQHVESFNPLEPHYRREHAPLRRYLPSDINITLMHKHFCETYSDKNISYSLYRSHVKKMNISFTDLGNEECEVCEAYNFHKKDTSHDPTSQILEECSVCVNWDRHRQRYRKARDLYTSHKEEQQNNSQIFYSADLEKVIMLPRLETFKAAIFCQRLIAYNQTFAPLGKITAECKPLTVIWHDSIAGRKQEDIMSAFYHFLLRNRDVRNIHIWLDNCSSQNKNWLLYSMLVHIINSELTASEKITLYYFEPGHTFMSSDQVHHQVELAMKKKGKLYDFTDFEECVSSINKSKVVVQSMLPENFLNIPNNVSQRRIQSSNPKAYLKNMVQVCFTRKSYDLMYKNNFDDTMYTSLRFMNDKYLKNPNIMSLEFRTEPKGVDPKRKAEILEKLSSIIPSHKLLFWKNLPTLRENETFQ